MRQLLYLFALCVVFLTSSRCQASEIKVEVFREAEMVQSVTLPEGKLKISVKDFSFDPNTKIWNLENRCAITIVQDEERSIQFKGDSAKIEAAAEDIEWQIFAEHYDVSFDLSDFLKSHPEALLVRINWGWSMGGYGSSSTALYDRRQNSIREYDVSGDTHVGGTWRYGYLLTGVTDAMIYKTTKETDPAFDDQFDFKKLTDYGAVLKYWMDNSVLKS